MSRCWFKKRKRRETENLRYKTVWNKGATQECAAGGFYWCVCLPASGRHTHLAIMWLCSTMRLRAWLLPAYIHNSATTWTAQIFWRMCTFAARAPWKVWNAVMRCDKNVCECEANFVNEKKEKSKKEMAPAICQQCWGFTWLKRPARRDRVPPPRRHTFPRCTLIARTHVQNTHAEMKSTHHCNARTRTPRYNGDTTVHTCTAT